MGRPHRRLHLISQMVGQVAHHVLDLVTAAALRGILFAEDVVNVGSQGFRPVNHKQAPPVRLHPAPTMSSSNPRATT